MDNQPRHWSAQLSQRERDQIRACLAYHSDHETAGLPGHGLMILVAKLAKMVDAQSLVSGQMYGFETL